MSIILGIIIIILVLANALLILSVGYFIGHEKGRKEVQSKLGDIFSAFIHSIADKDEDEGEDDEGDKEDKDKPEGDSEPEPEADISQSL